MKERTTWASWLRRLLKSSTEAPCPNCGCFVKIVDGRFIQEADPQYSWEVSEDK